MMSSPDPKAAVAELVFAGGLVGLPALVNFSVRAVDGPIVELVSMQETDFGLLAIAGELVRPGLGALLVERDLAEAGDEILVVLSIHGDPPAVTANLAGPIVVATDGTARQLVVEDPSLSVRTPVDTTTP
jgi:flagellar assembly factor FliW